MIYWKIPTSLSLGRTKGKFPVKSGLPSASHSFLNKLINTKRSTQKHFCLKKPHRERCTDNYAVGIWNVRPMLDPTEVKTQRARRTALTAKEIDRLNNE
eukprot:719485-Amorphochlora_amoeboformis.AAC.1